MKTTRIMQNNLILLAAHRHPAQAPMKPTLTPQPDEPNMMSRRTMLGRTAMVTAGAFVARSGILSAEEPVAGDVADRIGSAGWLRDPRFQDAQVGDYVMPKTSHGDVVCTPKNSECPHLFPQRSWCSTKPRNERCSPSPETTRSSSISTAAFVCRGQSGVTLSHTPITCCR